MPKKVIRVDFTRERRREESAFEAFEKAMIEYERKQKLKMGATLILFCIVLTLAMSIPFVIESLLK